MKRNNFKILSYLLITVFLTLGLSISFQSLLAAWTAPLANPPTCLTGDPGCDGPINIGSFQQTKGGPLRVNMDNIAATGFAVYGNVGIGTTSPNEKLEIAGSHGTTKLRLYASGFNQPAASNDAYLNLWASEPGWTYTGTGIGNNILGSPYYGRINTERGGSYIRLLDNAIYLSTIDSAGSVANNIFMSNGNVGIGTTSPGSYKLKVQGDVNVTGTLTAGAISGPVSVPWGSVTGKPTLPSSQEGSRYTTDFNTILSTGFFNAEGTPANSPGGSYGQLITARGIDTGLQIYGGYGNDQLWFRGWANYGSTWYPWRTVLHSGNYSSYAYPASNPLEFISGNQTITLSGDATGSGDTAIPVTVVNDSHTHTASTISGLGVADFSSPDISQWTNDSGYYSSGSSPSFNNVSASNNITSHSWFYNTDAGEGLYNSATASNFYSESTGYWTVDSDHGLIFRNGYAGTITGRVYWDGTAGSNNFGLLSPNGSWRVRVDNTNVELYGGAYMATSYANILYDRQNTGYYVDPASTSNLNTVYASVYMYSDESLKEDIKKISNPLEKITQLEGVEFKWKEDGKSDIGLIAQDVEKVFPELVETNPENGKKLIQYSSLAAPLIEAVKELAVKIIGLTDKVENLYQKYAGHRDRIEALEKVNLEQQTQIDELKTAIEAMAK